MKLTAEDIVRAIARLPRDRRYNYINPRTSSVLKIVRVELPAGPIVFHRWDGQDSGAEADAVDQSISTAMLWRVANAFEAGLPVNLDRVLGGSYNTRSVLESLMAHTPEFYYCYPGRVFSAASTTTIERGHKHMLWVRERPHESGTVTEMETDITISEVPSRFAIYDGLEVPGIGGAAGVVDDTLRRHAQMQVALMEIGNRLSCRSWIARNDHSITYKGKKLIEMDGVVRQLGSEPLLSAFQEAARAGELIDCLWFRNSRFMPAVFEVEHSTGVTSGLTRMKAFRDKLPEIRTRWIIVAPDEIEAEVSRKCSEAQFVDLNPRYLPYTAVEELLGLAQRGRLDGLGEQVIENFARKIAA